MIRFHPSAALVAGALAAAATVFAAPLRWEQFAVGWPIDVEAQQRIVDVPLSLDVYRQISSDAELALLDASGNPMPFYRVIRSAAAAEARTALAPSPLYSAVAADSVAQLSVATADRRTNVTVTRASEGAPPEIVAFVADAHAVEVAPFAVDLDWRSLSQPFLLDVLVEQSNTLTDWRPVGRASVASLAIDGAEVRHARVPVRASPGGYFRITWSRAPSDWYLQGVLLVSSATPRPLTESASFVPLDARDSPANGPSGALYFDAGGPLPVTSAAVDFPAGTGWTRAGVASASSLEGPWSTVAAGTLFYELDFDGRHLASEPLAVGRQPARYWRVTPAERVTPDRISLRLEYAAETLRFSAEGTAPYLLAAGTRSREAGPDATFAAVWRELPAGATPLRAELGPQRELGGAAALEEPREIPWRKAVLSTVLVGGALAVAWMAVRLARELREPPS